VAKSDHLMADNGTLHDEVLQIFAEIFRAEFRSTMPQIG
jgi:hypothetical protein